MIDLNLYFGEKTDESGGTISRHILPFKDEELYNAIKEQNMVEESFRKANDEKNDFLEKLGIVSGGEFHRMSFYLNQKMDRIADLEEQLRNYQQPTGICDVCYTDKDYALERYSFAFDKMEYLMHQALASQYTNKKELFNTPASDVSPLGDIFKQMFNMIDDVNLILKGKKNED